MDDVQVVEWRDDHEQIVRHTFFLALGQKKPLREAVRLGRILEGLATVLADHQPVVQHIAGNFVGDDEDGFVAVSLDRVASAFHCEKNQSDEKKGVEKKRIDYFYPLIKIMLLE